MLPKTTIRSHVEDRLEAAGVPVFRDGPDQELPGVVTSGERQPAQIWVNLAARSIADPPGYLVFMEVSHLQNAVLRRVETVPVAGLDWQESWALVIHDDTNVLAATDSALDPLIDDFAKDFQAASRSSP